MSVPVTVDDTFATVSVATAFEIPAEAPVSWNFTDIVLPSLNNELPSASTGWRTPDHPYWTWTWNDPVELFPWASVAVQITLVVPKPKVEPEAGVQTGVTGPSNASTAVAE